jgi:hypothetical protein
MLNRGSTNVGDANLRVKSMRTLPCSDKSQFIYIKRRRSDLYFLFNDMFNLASAEIGGVKYRGKSLSTFHLL